MQANAFGVRVVNTLVSADPGVCPPVGCCMQPDTDHRSVRLRRHVGRLPLAAGGSPRHFLANASPSVIELEVAIRRLAPPRSACLRQRERGGGATTDGHAATGARQESQDAPAERRVAMSGAGAHLMR